MLKQTSDALLGVGIIATTIALSPLLRPWYARWGATATETSRTLPGDDRVPHPRLTTTRAITIDAPPDQVWPWVIQIGQGRGGFYSYDLLENLAGCAIHSADRLLPAYQSLHPGDVVRLGPEGYPFFTVVDCQPAQWLVLLAGDTQTQQSVQSSWAFVVEPHGTQAMRLLVRTRTDYAPGYRNTLIWRVLTDPIQFAMERRMLLGIKARVAAADTRST